MTRRRQAGRRERHARRRHGAEGPAQLRAALLARSDAFVTSGTEKLMTYALGRRLEAHDQPAVRRIVREAARIDYRFTRSCSAS